MIQLRDLLVVLSSCFLLTTAVADEIPTATPESVGMSSDRLARFSSAMNAGIRAGHFPGAVAAVSRNGKIVFFESYGLRDQEAGLPMTDDAIFRIASMTKAITAVAVMILYEEGRFSLHDPISTYIPAFKDSRVLIGREPSDDKSKWSIEELDEWVKDNWDSLTDEEKRQVLALYEELENRPPATTSASAETEPAERPITIRDLLRHTAGITYNMGDIRAPGDSLGQMIDKLAGQPLKAQPGTRFQYGLSIDVLARLVEVVSEQSFDEFIKERIFVPLEMKDTAFYVPAEQAARLVKMPVVEEDDRQYKKGSAQDSYLSPPEMLAGGSRLVSTTMDYLRFCMMLLNDGELSGNRILGRKTVELMRANHMNDVSGITAGSGSGGEFRHGLSFGVHDEPAERGELGSEGSYYWLGSYGTTFWIDPKENLTGVFMVNGLDHDPIETRPYGELLEHFAYQAIVD